MRRCISTLVLVCAAFLVLLGTGEAEFSNARLLVYRNPTPGRPVGSPTPPFETINHSGIANAGFSQIAEYTARTLYEGPASAAPALIEELKAAGYHAEIATELDSVLFNDYLFDADTGTTTPPVPTSEHRPVAKDGLYILALRGYPTGLWLADLESRNVRIVEALPPAGYLVRGERSRMPTLKGQASYVRGVFPFTPGMKKVLFGTGTPPDALRQVAIHAYEENETESLTAYLSSIDDKMTVERTSGHSRYHASLSDVDIETLTAFETVYSISPIGEPMLSSERQGVLVLQPTVTSGRLELPSVTPGYTGILVAKGISNFSNTSIGMVDSGFDNGRMTGGSPIHPDFTSPAILECTDPNFANCKDDTTHGTVVASVIAGWPPAGMRQDSQGYRWGLGLAPTARLVVRRNFTCGGPATSLREATDALIARNVNIVNVSANNIVGGNPLVPVCSYDDDSREFDRRTRQRVWLFTVSAGNVRTGASCNTVQAPATGKNVLAVGATENFTLNWQHDANPKPEECDWCKYPPDFAQLQDGRNIPSFSAQRASTASNLFKPDLVAPGVRVTGPFTRSFACAGGGTAFCNRIVTTYADPNFPAYLPGPGQPLIPAGLHYGYAGGTSFAAPAAAGAAAVVRKWYANVTGIPTSNPSPALTKAMLINGARSVQGGTIHGKDFANLGTVQHITHDPRQGFGMLNLQRLLRTVTMPNFYFFDQAKTLTLGPPPDTFWEKLLTVRDGSQVIRITLVWTDAAGTVGQPYKVANDLTLGAYQSACFPCWYGNNINNTGVNAGLSNTNSTRDGKNNVEEIIIPGGYYASGSTIRVFVNADNLTADGIVPDGSPKRQDFAIFVDNAY